MMIDTGFENGEKRFWIKGRLTNEDSFDCAVDNCTAGEVVEFIKSLPIKVREIYFCRIDTKEIFAIEPLCNVDAFSYYVRRRLGESSKYYNYSVFKATVVINAIDGVSLWLYI